MTLGLIGMFISGFHGGCSNASCLQQGPVALGALTCWLISLYCTDAAYVERVSCIWRSRICLFPLCRWAQRGSSEV